MSTKNVTKPKQKREIGVSYTDRKTGKRRYVYRSDFRTVEEYLNKAENIILYAKNPRTLRSRRKRK